MAIKLNMTRHDMHHIINAMHLTTGVEIGVAHGEYSQYLLNHSNLDVLWSVDSWTGKYANLKLDAVSNLDGFGSRSSIRHMTSVEAAAHAVDIGQTFDFIYIDGNHRKNAVLEDVKTWFPLLKHPGIFAGHDYVHGENMTNVCPVIEELSERIKMPFYLTAEHWATWFFLL